MNSDHHLILASKSPRRQQLLQSAGLDFELQLMEVDETYSPDLPASDVARYLARKKAMAFEISSYKAVIITADTVVKVDNEILGKPKNKDEAFSMLSKLSGRSHEVITGVCLRGNNKTKNFDCTTLVHFDTLTQKVIQRYVNQYQPFDKAGAYGIQECLDSNINLCSTDEKRFLEEIGKPELYKNIITNEQTQKAPLNIKSIEGSFFNVVGLPIDMVFKELLLF